MKASEYQRRIGLQIHSYNDSLIEALNNQFQLSKLGVGVPWVTVHIGDGKIHLGPAPKGFIGCVREIRLEVK